MDFGGPHFYSACNQELRCFDLQPHTAKFEVAACMEWKGFTDDNSNEKRARCAAFFWWALFLVNTSSMFLKCACRWFISRICQILWSKKLANKILTLKASAEVCPMHLACWFLFHGSYSLDFWALGLMQCFGVSFVEKVLGTCCSSRLRKLGDVWCAFFACLCFFSGKFAMWELYIQFRIYIYIYII